MTPTADQVIAWLENNWLGWQEPWWDDHIPFQEKHGYPRGVIVEWCGGLQCEAQWANGGTYGTPIPPRNAANAWYTPTGVQQFINAGRWTHEPRRGSWAFFDWGGAGLGWSGGMVDHVGIVTGPILHDDNGTPVLDDEGQQMIDTSGGYVDTIEGNVDEACGRFRRRFSSGTIRGFGLPIYAPAFSDAQPPEPEHPHRFIPFTESEDDLMLVITLTGDNLDIPNQWGVVGGVLFPVDAPEVGGDMRHVSMSKAVFLNFYAKYVWANRLALDLQPLAA